MEVKVEVAQVGKVGVGGVTWQEGEYLDYATIAKAGGRRDLLHHITDEASRNKPPLANTAPQPHTVDWFAHPTTPERLAKTEYVSPMKDHWCQWDTTVPKLPDIAKQGKGGLTFPPITQRDDVNFARLLSLDYQREWLQGREEKQNKLKRNAKAKKISQVKKLQDHSMKVRKNQVEVPQDKNKFVMKRFQNIPSRVKLPPI